MTTRLEANHMTMEEALAADGEKLQQMTGEDHGPWYLADEETQSSPEPQPADLDFSVGEAPPPTNRMTNATWRILEEQRVNALEVAAECDEAIAKLLAKRDDALKAAAMCAVGQKGVS